MDPVPRTERTIAPAKFVTGSILRHILVMTSASALGLMAVFAGDLLNMYFLSTLGDEALVAAVGYASSILFFSTSIGIGLAIAAVALVSQAIGAGMRVRARRLSAHAHVLAFAVSATLSIVLWFFIPTLLTLLGAEGRAHAFATVYLTILIPTLPLLAIGMTSMAVLRSVGDARRAMHVTLVGATVNMLLDVILILGFGFGIEGAAVASALARLAVMGVGLYGVVYVHDLMSRPKIDTLVNDWPAYAAIAVPAVLTNLATPVGNAYVTAAVSPFGDGAVAGWAVLGRIMPVAFGAIYALSGAVGPILGQNRGAGIHERMQGTLTQSLYVMVAFTATAWLLLALLADPLAAAFNATGEARDLIVYFCRWLAPLFVFLGALFIANAVFNTLGRAHFSTAINWARASIGTIPFVMLGAAMAGAKGALAGNMLGGIPFGLLAVWLAYRLIHRIGQAPDADKTDSIDTATAAATMAEPDTGVPQTWRE
ncbi:MAG: MATE family efflux transporter [Hyphomicrobium sp.]